MLKDCLSLNPHRDWASRRATLKHNIWLVCESTLVAVVITCVWYLFVSYGWTFRVHEEVELVMLSTAILVCAAIMAFIAATLFAQARERNSRLSRAMLLGEEPEFMLWRDEKVQIMMHVVVGFYGFAVIALFGIAGYVNVQVGAAIVFFVSGSIVVYFIAIIEMQQVKRNLWIRKNAPAEWLEHDVIQYFIEHRKKTVVTRVDLKPELRDTPRSAA